MEKIITYETLAKFAYSNDKIVKQPIKRIIISFYGLGGMMMYSDDFEDSIKDASEGCVLVYPYLNPWNWMNNEAVKIADEIIDVLFEKYNLKEDTEIISTGGSMGGLCAITYCAYAKRRPHACVAICPVCDLPYHYTERVDLPRTLYSAFYNFNGTLQEALESASPIHLVNKLPDIPYVLFHCEEDKAVNIEKHSNTFVRCMKDAGKHVDYYTIPEKGHCQLPPEDWAKYQKILQTI